MFFYIRFIIVWVIWFLFADKKRWKELFCVSIFAGYLGLLTDVVLVDHFQLWSYQGEHKEFAEVGDDIGMYMVVPYFFIQWLPKNKTIQNLFGYFFIWTTFCIGIEWIHTYTGHMVYDKWWNHGWSYLCDWILFWSFYKFHQIFRLKELSKDTI